MELFIGQETLIEKITDCNVSITRLNEKFYYYSSDIFSKVFKGFVNENGANILRTLKPQEGSIFSVEVSFGRNYVRYYDVIMLEFIDNSRFRIVFEDKTSKSFYFDKGVFLTVVELIK